MKRLVIQVQVNYLDIIKENYSIMTNILNECQKSSKGKKTCKCNICEKAFKTSAKLTLHKRSHIGENPFRCNICENTFTNLFNLTRHKLSHTGEKLFKCNICKKAFKTSPDLYRHSYIHSEENHSSVTFMIKH